MKTIIIFFSLFLIVISSYSKPIQLNGVLNDISPDELKILYACKNNLNEAYSDGILYLFDMVSNKTIEIARIKNMDYNIKSYFINNETILIATNNSISLYDLKTKSIVKTILQLKPQEFFTSSQVLSSAFYYESIDYKDSKLNLVKIDSNDLSIKTIISTKASILPTDNFFDFFILQEKVFILDNGNLSDLSKNILVSLNQNVAFNNTYGKYIIATNNKTICMVKRDKNKYKLTIVSQKNEKPLFVNVPININNRAWLETIITNGNKSYILIIGNETFLIGDDGSCVKAMARIIYSSNRIIIKKAGMYKFEVSNK